jgi:hypothetical protein
MTTNVDDNNSEVVEMGSVGVGSKSLASMNVAYSGVVTPVKMRTIVDVPHDDGGKGPSVNVGSTNSTTITGTTNRRRARRHRMWLELALQT